MSLVHDRRGSGPPLVLVHGHGLRWQEWEPVLPALAAHHEVVALDLPGFGSSPLDGTTPSPEGYAARVEEFWGELGLERPAVAGFSMGGGVALELARRGSVTRRHVCHGWAPRSAEASSRFCPMRRNRATTLL